MVLDVFVSGDIESIADVDGDVLVFRGMVDAVLSDEFKGVVGGVFFEDADGAFGESDAEFVGLGVLELDFVGGFEVGLRVTA